MLGVQTIEGVIAEPELAGGCMVSDSVGASF